MLGMNLQVVFVKNLSEEGANLSSSAPSRDISKQKPISGPQAVK